MRLLNTASIEVERFTGKAPPYAILSHRWEEDEVTLEDMKPGGDARGMKGFRKLRLSCAMAVRQGLKYIWIDTCCIDKTSSAELSESINSMFRYYQEAVVCYAYLSDVSCVEMSSDLTSRETDFEKSLWWSRGWTLQELIAPKNLGFYNKEWDFLGNKADFRNLINRITKIPEGILLGGELAEEAVSRKMFWVSSRTTTVPEDIAYCLLGVFGVNIPLLYGEGAENAFLRLQEAILKSTDDESIFLWRSPEEEAIKQALWGIFAKSPSYFADSSDIKVPCYAPMATNTPATLTGRGVNLEFLMARLQNDTSQTIYSAVIYADGGKKAYGIILQKLLYSGGLFARVGADVLLDIDRSMRINYSKLPDRFSTRWGYISRASRWARDSTGDLTSEYLNPVSSSLGHLDNHLGEARPLRFYVRQNPRVPLPTSTEAVGFCFDLEKSLPQEISVDDWSSKWSRWEQGPLNKRSIYILDFEGDGNLRSWLPPKLAYRWALTEKANIHGVLRLSDTASDTSKQLALCVGLQQTPTNLLDTPVSYPVPCCRIYNMSKWNKNPDEVLGMSASRTCELFSNDARIEGTLGEEDLNLVNCYSLSVELHIQHGQVYYLIKLGRTANAEKDRKTYPDAVSQVSKEVQLPRRRRYHH